MKSAMESAVEWVDGRLESMLAAPRMWGSREAVELQTLLLLELRAITLRPHAEAATPRRILDSYIKQLRDRFPDQPPLPLHKLMPETVPESEFVSVLREFRDVVFNEVRGENPFQRSELALRLTFKGQPTASAFTSYYDEFRRAVRALARPPGKTQGRHPRDIEHSSDFVLEDTRVSGANGTPAQVLMLLSKPPGQQDYVGDETIRNALGSLTTMAEWACSPGGLDSLEIDDPQIARHTAMQALRMIPSRGIVAVDIGGLMIGRTKPVELRPALEPRFVEAISHGVHPVLFDERREIRAIDLDRGSIVLGGRPRILCYLRPRLLEGVTRVGVEAKVVGEKYSIGGARPFVLVREIDLPEVEDE